MAQLHGRVRELHDRRLSGPGAPWTALWRPITGAALATCLALFAGLWCTQPAQGQDTPDLTTDRAAPELAALATDLASADPAVRQTSIETLSTLPASALPAIAERLTRLRRGRPSRDDAGAALTAIRRAAGSRRADDMVDIAPGVSVLLETDRSSAVVRVAEPLLLLRSLERIGTTDALRLVPEVLRLDGEPWRMEGRRVTLRLGDRVAAAAIHARSGDDAEGRTWARWTSDRLDLGNPGALAQRMSGSDLAEVLTAYSATHTLAAIPVVASFVDADQRRLRDAAREALRGYRQNGIWVARETFETRLGTTADLSWGWERTLEELFSRLDAARAEHLHVALADATQAIERGADAEARSALDLALLRSPELATPEAAALYAQLAERESLPEAREALLRRALAIAPDADQANHWRGLLAFQAAQEELTVGVLDVARFSAAADAAPACVDCVAMRDTLAGQAALAQIDRTLAFAFAASLFAILGLLLLTWTWAAPRARTPAGTAAASLADADPRAHGEPLLLADDTLS